MVIHLCFNLDLIDDCVDVQCLQGGVCVDGIQSYTCQCQEGWTGEHCDTGKISSNSSKAVQTNTLQGLHVLKIRYTYS